MQPPFSNDRSTLWCADAPTGSWTCPTAPRAAYVFHQHLDGYSPTPLREVPSLASELDVARLFIKDESMRFDLGAFKILGASWAVVRALAERTDYHGDYSIAALGAWLQNRDPIRLVTATDGNHGRAVARMARLLGLAARVYVPDVVPDGAVGLIRSEGCEVQMVAGSYDETVKAARDDAADRHAVLIQDTSWEGYEDIPTWIVEGYATLFLEVDQQLTSLGAGHPDLVVIPVGVGSLAQAAITHYRSDGDSQFTALLSVEPDTAACVLASLRQDRMQTVETQATPMNGLNCGTPSTLAWPFLRNGLDAAVAISDEECASAIEDLKHVGIISGFSGAASFAGVRRALTGPDAAKLRQALGLTARSTVVVLSTEGDHKPIPAI